MRGVDSIDHESTPTKILQTDGATRFRAQCSSILLYANDESSTTTHVSSMDIPHMKAIRLKPDLSRWEFYKNDFQILKPYILKILMVDFLRVRIYDGVWYCKNEIH